MKGELQRGEVARSILSHVPETRNPELMEVDRELEELLKRQHSKVRVFGVGGAGGNTISRMKEIGIRGGEFIAVNTDAQDLLYSNADHKILIGKELTMGLGAGSNPKIGEEAAHEQEQERKKLKMQSMDWKEWNLLLIH